MSFLKNIADKAKAAIGGDEGLRNIKEYAQNLGKAAIEEGKSTLQEAQALGKVAAAVVEQKYTEIKSKFDAAASSPSDDAAPSADTQQGPSQTGPKAPGNN